jgi:Leucine-rich repeat (LRR) protein
MKQRCFFQVLTFILTLLFLAASQTWKDDSLVVRQILDTNGLTELPVEGVIIKGDSGRVTILGLYNYPTFNILPASIRRLTKLNTLNIEKTNLNILPPEIGDLNMLRVLTLISNKISMLPPEIGKLSSLTTLRVILCSNFKSIPEEICNLNSLRILDLYDNALTTLPKDIGNLVSLEQVALDYNNLTTLPQSIINLSLKPYKFKVCYNDSLTFTPEQCAWFGIKDYKDYFRRYCPTELTDDGASASVKSVYIPFLINARTISVNIFKSSAVYCSVYDIRGQCIETVLVGNLPAGTYTTKWDRTRYAAGVYSVRLVAGQNITTKKVIVAK